MSLMCSSPQGFSNLFSISFIAASAYSSCLNTSMYSRDEFLKTTALGISFIKCAICLFTSFSTSYDMVLFLFESYDTHKIDTSVIDVCNCFIYSKKALRLNIPVSLSRFISGFSSIMKIISIPITLVYPTISTFFR